MIGLGRRAKIPGSRILMPVAFASILGGTCTLIGTSELGLDPRAFAVTVALAASSSFITPLEPASLLVYGPGRYRFRDFFLVGLPLTRIVFVVTLLLVPRLWPLGWRPVGREPSRLHGMDMLR